MVHEELYIPAYEETYRGVIESYQQDPHAYGLHGYEYKMASDRPTDGRHAKVGYLSGTFSFFDIGCLGCVHKAKENCDYLIVGVRHGGAMEGEGASVPLDERKAVVAACRYVDEVVDAPDGDDLAWDIYHYDALFVGPDCGDVGRIAHFDEELDSKGIRIVRLQ